MANSVGPALVAVGGSAGGLEALKAVLHGLPASFPVPILAVLHLDPKKPSNAADLLGTHTALQVRPAKAGERPRAGTVYLAPPDRHLELRAGRIALTRTPRVNFSRPSVDRLFASVAQAHGKRALAIVLSGTGFDGRQGVQAVKAAGGACVAQDPETASQGGMPESAIATGCVDAVLPADRIGGYLLHATGGGRVPATAAAWRSAEALLRRKCGVDFRGYRPETLRRRMESRIAATGSKTAAQYVAALRRDDLELERLRSALLVKVSSFVRDPALWTVLKKRALAPLIKAAGKREIRMWSAGCATGEEAYTMALLTLAAAKGRPIALKVFGTDLDDPALAKARAGKYTAQAVDDFPRPLAKQYFVADGAGPRVGPELRRHVVFGRHDLARDAPLASMDLVACRNVLIYLKPAERAQVLAQLAGAVRPGGFLFLGKAEGTHLPAPGFVRVAPGAPIFRRVEARPLTAAGLVRAARRTGRARQAAAHEPIVLAVDASLRITMWNTAAERFFGRPAKQAVGAFLPSLLHGSGSDLDEAALRQALSAGRRRRLPEAALDGAGARRAVALEAVPLPQRAGMLLMGTAQASTPVKPDAAARHALLASMEAQQSLNEELQSRNEELETVNEELQSLNDEIQVQGDEARRATLFLGALLEAGPDVMVGCDRQGRVSYWGTPAMRKFGLSASQALGKDLLKLVPKLDTASVRQLLRPGVKWPKKGRAARQVKASDGLRVAVFPALDHDGKSHGTLLRILDSKA
ncbi:MAG: two-component system, chemotaxis family, CheB/CheR fusion protein [Thermoplasmata archaeon]|jgi:two-component system CheB/CheR fusion protein|nr:two-component system, chemotaxis family, CheB/CheR fusion protein [Thermoplasmata archaeon]